MIAVNSRPQLLYDEKVTFFGSPCIAAAAAAASVLLLTCCERIPITCQPMCGRSTQLRDATHREHSK